MTNSFLLLIISGFLYVPQCRNISEEIIIFATIPGYGGLDSQAYEAAQWLAIREINENSNFLPNYELKLQSFASSEGNYRESAMVHALNITNTYHNRNRTYFPLTLGYVYSSLSTATTPILAVFNMGTISSATSVLLSDTSRYPYFYRIMASDSLQSAGILSLCDTFNWTKVAVVYVNDAWGVYLSLGILQSSKQYDIEVTTIAVHDTFSEGDDSTYTYAAKQIKDLRTFIIVMIIHSTEIGSILRIFDTEGIIGYPYFYIGTDGWFASSTVYQQNLTNYMAGWIGTVPWQNQNSPLREYTDDNQFIVNKSNYLWNDFVTKYNDTYHNGYRDKLVQEMPSLYSSYGYDSVYTIAHAMQYIEAHPHEYGGKTLLEFIRNEDKRETIQLLNDIIINKIDFIGLSGSVSFDEHGDRVRGFLSFGNMLQDETINYIGYFFTNLDGNIEYKLNVSQIQWPQDFVERGMIPRTDILTYKKMITLSTSASITAMVVSSLSIVYAVCCICLSIYHRKEKIIKAVSWKLNIIICVGAILAYIRVIVQSIDEVWLDGYDTQSQREILSVACNVRIWVTTIAFTLLFVPLFAKTYRLSKIFDDVLVGREITDRKLFVLIGICVMGDIVLLTILTAVKSLQRICLAANIQTIDEIRQVQYVYGTCTFTEATYFGGTFWYFYGVIALWKMSQAFWGIHVTMIVSGVRGPMLKQLIKFDETGSQLFSIMFTFVVGAVALPLWVFGIMAHNMLMYYCVDVVGIILIANVVVSVNLLPRICAVLKGKQNRFDRSPREALECAIIKQLKSSEKKQKRDDTLRNEKRLILRTQLSSGMNAMERSHS